LFAFEYITMGFDYEIPIVVGVGDIKNRSTSVADAKEPAVLMHEAILAAIQDARPSDASKLQADIDSIDVVKTWTWPYPDLPGLLAEKLGVKPKQMSYSEHGGNQPGKLFDEAARKIAKGECKVAVVTGGEALASREFRVSNVLSCVLCTAWGHALRKLSSVDLNLYIDSLCI